MRSGAVHIRRFEEHLAAKSLIPRRGLDHTLRTAQLSVDHVCICDRGAQSRAAGGEALNRRDFILREGANRQR